MSDSPAPEAAIQHYLEDNGYPDHIVAAGSAGLIRRWREFVGEVEAGYAYGLNDYRNDLDIRGLIRLFGFDAQVSDEDGRFEEMLVSRQVRVWESGPGDPAWDFGFPRNPGRWLARELQAAGFTDSVS